MDIRHTEKIPGKRHRPGVRTLNVDIATSIRRALDRRTKVEDRTLRSVVERALLKELNQN